MNIDTRRFIIVSQKAAEARALAYKFTREVEDGHPNLISRYTNSSCILGRTISFYFTFVSMRKSETITRGFRGVILTEEEFEERKKLIIDMILMFNPDDESGEDKIHIKLEIGVVGYESSIPTQFESLVRYVTERFLVYEVNRASNTITFGLESSNMLRIHLLHKVLVDFDEFKGIIINKNTFEEHKVDIMRYIGYEE